MQIVKPILVCIILISLAACGDSPTSPPPQSTFPDFSATPRPNANAEYMALWLSGEIVAPQQLYDRVLNMLTLIDEQLGDSLEAWDDLAELDNCAGFPDCIERNAVFLPGWDLGRLSVTMVNDSTYERRKSGIDTAWNEFLAKFPVDSVSYYISTGRLMATISFGGRLHMPVLADYFVGYEGLASVQVNPNRGLFIAPPTYFCRVYPVMRNDDLELIYVFSWDCTPNCLSSSLYHVSTDPSGELIVDHVAYIYGEDEPVRPSWIDDLLEVRSDIWDTKEFKWTLQ